MPSALFSVKPELPARRARFAAFVRKDLVPVVRPATASELSDADQQDGNAGFRHPLPVHEGSASSVPHTALMSLS